MNHTVRKSTRRMIIAIPLFSLFVNAAFADPSADRLSTYKANRLIPQEFQSQTSPNLVFNMTSLSWTSENKNSNSKFSNLSYEELKAQLNSFLASAETDATAMESAHEIFDYLMALAQGKEVSTDEALVALGPIEKLLSEGEFSITDSRISNLLQLAAEQGWSIDFTGLESSIAGAYALGNISMGALDCFGSHFADPNIKGITPEFIARLAQCPMSFMNCTFPAMTITENVTANGGYTGQFSGSDFSRCSFASEKAVSNLMEYNGHYTFNVDTFNKFNDAILKSKSNGANWSVKVSGGDFTVGQTIIKGSVTYQITEIKNGVATIKQTRAQVG